MKTLRSYIMTIIIFVGAPAISIKAQVSHDSTSQYMQNQNKAKQYFKKSHDQKVTATVLGIGGGILLVTGVALAAASLNGFLDPNTRHNDYGSAPDILSIGGGALIVAAIPFSLASRANKKKAKLYMSRETVVMIPGIKTTNKFTSIGIKVSL